MRLVHPVIGLFILSLFWPDQLTSGWHESVTTHFVVDLVFSVGTSKLPLFAHILLWR